MIDDNICCANCGNGETSMNCTWNKKPFSCINKPKDANSERHGRHHSFYTYFAPKGSVNPCAEVMANKTQFEAGKKGLLVQYITESDATSGEISKFVAKMLTFGSGFHDPVSISDRFMNYVMDSPVCMLEWLLGEGFIVAVAAKPEPFQVTLTFNSDEELKGLYHRLNCAPSQFKEYSSGRDDCVYKSITKTESLWCAISAEMRKRGINR